MSVAVHHSTHNFSIFVAVPIASPMTLPLLLFATNPTNFSFVASAAVYLRKNTPCTLPKISNDRSFILVDDEEEDALVAGLDATAAVDSDDIAAESRLGKILSNKQMR